MNFAIEKIQSQLREIRAAVHREATDLPNFTYHDGDCPGAELPAFDDSGWADFRVGETWGGYDRIAWFRTHVAVPPAWRDEKLVLRFLVGPRDGGLSTAETQLYVNGARLQAIDVWHEEAWLPPELLAAPELSIALRAWSGIYGVPDRRRFKVAQLVRVDQAAERLYYLVDTLLKAIRLQDENDARRAALLRLLKDAWRRLDLSKPGSAAFYASIAAAGDCLVAGLNTLRVPDIRPTVTAVGHSHIDMAWMWRLHHTREKAVRTFSTMLHLMRQYPEFRYAHSSPQLYQFVKEDAPEIYACVRERVAEGRWEVLGGSWVEFDTNLPGGEALVRQILFGKQYTRDEFDRDCAVLWLPDSFGFSWVLPGLMARSGLRYFCTSVIGQNHFTRFPYDTFRWRGMDGSEVLVHMITTPGDSGDGRYTYNGVLSPEQVAANWRNYRQKEINAETLMTFGWGDGGGGPMAEMLEAGRVQAHLPGHPAVRTDTVASFFDRLAARTSDESLPLWDGELYMQASRGSYTSQARVKNANRRAETLYHDAEWLSALAGILTGDAGNSKQALRPGWERLLLLQFHDILPGTSIHDVYTDSLADYARITEIGEAAAGQATARLSARIGTGDESLVVFNPLGWQRDDVVAVPWSASLAGKQVLGPDGRPLPTQLVDDGGERRLLVAVPGVPSLGYRVYPLQPEPCPAVHEGLTITPRHLENAYWRIELTDAGQIGALYDRVNDRQVLAPGTSGNVLQAFEDRPILADAWEIDPHYEEKTAEVTDLVEAAVEESGPVRGTLRLRWRLAQSTITQRLSLYGASPRIDFRTELDWHEQHVLLKAAFPILVRATSATYEIQFGTIQRPTHRNTAWDAGQFENPAQKWVDLSEGNYGVALLNDGKHGYDVRDNVLRLSLHRSPTDPDPRADQGRHTFTYSLLPHAGTWQVSDVVPQAYALNDPLRTAVLSGHQQGDLPPAYSLASVDATSVVLETIKQAEDGEGWIVRLYEGRGYRHGAVQLTFGQPLQGAVECNLLEEEEKPATWAGCSLTFPIAPYEIKTFKVWF